LADGARAEVLLGAEGCEERSSISVTVRVYSARFAGIVSSPTLLGSVIRLDRRRMDGVVAFVLVVATVLQVLLDPSIHDRPQAAIAGVVLCVAVGVRRRWPFGALLSGVAAVSGEAAFGGALAQHVVASIPAAMLSFYAAGAFLEQRRARLALAAAVAVLLIQVLLTPNTVSDLFFEPVILAFLPWACGRLLREHSHRERLVREYSEQLDAEREQRERRVRDRERMRIARELHDVIGHCLSVIVLQAGGARMVIASEPERAEAAIRAVERAGHDALSETRRLLRVFGGEGSGSLEPQPGLADIHALVSRTREAGLTADLLIEGTPRPISPALALCAYRIVQEALTNAIKHAGPARASVRVSWEQDRLKLEIADDGRGPASVSAIGSGHGIIGMRERAALHEGIVHTGAGTSCGYLVRASLPLIVEGNR
jgi:signal transduction histidine kinase